MNPSQLLSKVVAVIKDLPTVFLVVVFAILGFAVAKWFTKPTVVTETRTVSLTVHDTTQINRYINVVLRDTVTPSPTIIQKIVERVVKPDTVVTYVPISVPDSAAFGGIFLMSEVHRSGSSVSVEAVNLAARQYKRYAFETFDPSFDLGTNSKGVWMLSHRQWFSWDGLNLGGRYTFSGGYLMVSTGITILRGLDLTGSLLSTSKPLEVQLTYKVLR